MKISRLDNSNHRLQRSALAVRGAGRGGDSQLVHVNPREKRAMNHMFGPSSRNPHTGLPEHGLFSKLKKFAKKVHNTHKMEFNHMKDVTKEIIKNPKRTLTGPTPLGTKINNKIFGENKKPLTGQLGGSTQEWRNEYEEKHGPGSLGYGNSTNAAANAIAGWYAGGAVGDLAGAGASQLGASEAVAGAVGNGASRATGEGVSRLNAGTSGAGMVDTNKKKATKFLLGRAQALADREYSPYEGDRVAGMTQNEYLASDLAREGNPDSERLYDKAESAIDDSRKEFNRDNLEQYLNPYRDSAIENANEEYDRQNASLLNSKAGAFGGDRAAFAQSELSRNHMGNLKDINAKAYDQATNAFFADSDRQVRAAEAYRAVGGDKAMLNRQQIQDLMATGGIERALNQADLDFDYQQFVEARDWDVNNLEPLLRALGTTGQSAPGASGDNTAAAIGAAATIAGAYFGSSGGSSTPASTSPSSYGGQATQAGVS